MTARARRWARRARARLTAAVLAQPKILSRCRAALLLGLVPAVHHATLRARSDDLLVDCRGIEHVAVERIDRRTPVLLLGLSKSRRGESGKGDALTPFGVADPLAQAGDAAVTGVAARRSGQSLKPLPKFGFAGAAAVGAQGRFAGTANLKSPAAAGGGAVLPQATIVPADAIRGFLTAQGVTPGTAAATVGDQAAIEKSVVRVICVRK